MGGAAGGRVGGRDKGKRVGERLRGQGMGVEGKGVRAQRGRGWGKGYGSKGAEVGGRWLRGQGVTARLHGASGRSWHRKGGMWVRVQG